MSSNKRLHKSIRVRASGDADYSTDSTLSDTSKYIVIIFNMLLFESKINISFTVAALLHLYIPKQNL